MVFETQGNTSNKSYSNLAGHATVRPASPMTGRFWPYRFYLTIIALMVALSGADSWPVAGLIVGSGLALDVLRLVLPWSRAPQSLLAEIIEASTQDRSTVMRRSRLARLLIYPIPFVFLLFGLACAWLVPTHPTEGNEPLINPSWIFHVSHLCRKFVADLIAHGYSDRANYLPGFFSIIFATWFFCVIVGVFITPRVAVLECAWKTRYRALRGIKVTESYEWMWISGLCVFAFFFFIANNLDFVQWSHPLPDQAVYSSNFFFVSFSLGMGLAGAFVPLMGTITLLYYIGFRKSMVLTKEDADE